MSPPTEPSQQARHPLLTRLEGIGTYLIPLGVLTVFAFMIWSAYHLSTEVRYEDVRDAIAGTRWTTLELAAFFTGLSFAALILYDFNALDYIHRKLPPVPVAITAFSAYAVGNTLGFGALSGGAVRFRAYSRLGLSPDEVGKVIAFVTLAFGFGLTAVSAIAVLVTAKAMSPLVGIGSFGLRTAAIVTLLLLGLLLYVTRHGRQIEKAGIKLRLPDTATASRQFLVTAFDVAAAATVLYVLLPPNPMTWISFVAIYAGAIGLGVLSHVPAGLGVFEAAIIAALGGTMSVESILSSLLLYRIIYHIVPLIVAAVIMIAIEIRELARHPVAASLMSLEPRLTPTLLAALALVTGTVMIFSTVTPTPASDLDFLAEHLPLAIVEGAHFLSSVMGLVLFVSARGLAQRLDGAWWVAISAAAASFVFAFLRAVALYEAMLLIVLICGLWFARRQFTRPASLLRQALAPSWIVAMVMVLIAAFTILRFVYRDLEYTDTLWWQFEFQDEAPRGLRSVMGLSLIALAIAIASLLRPATRLPPPVTEEEITRAVDILATQDNPSANLVRMGDKRIMFSASGRSFLMYGIQGRSWIALFDPFGEAAEKSELVWRFVEEARTAGGKPVFYQISPALLPSCADAGLRAYRLGELAVADLGRFDLRGSRLAPLRHAMSRGQRDGLDFAVLEPAALCQVIEELRAISDAWLAQYDAREKSFSLGSFEDDYVTSQPVAILRGADGRIIAFATLLTTPTGVEATVDLMRFAPDAPKSAMDFLFVKTMEYLKDHGYARFNLGMAPLSGMSKREAAPVWDRLGSIMFEHGEKFYNFQGLKAFKSKFHPDWKPRYLAVAGSSGPVMAIMDATLLIGGGIRGVVRK